MKTKKPNSKNANVFLVSCPECTKEGPISKLREHLINDHAYDAQTATEVVNEIELTNSLYL